MTRPFVPILLGTEVGAYGMARAFYDAYGVRSICYGAFPLRATQYSRFVEQRCDEGFPEMPRFIEVLNRDAGSFGSAIPLVIPCGDEYSLMLSAHKAELDPRYVAVTSDAGVLDELNDKSRFYALCERAGAPYPKTVTIDGPMVPDELPFGFPVALKPTNAASYREHEFEGQKKAFILDDRAMLEECVRRVYASGYDAQLVIQEFVPGDDSNMRVVNGYVRSDGKPSLLSLGWPVLEDCEPMRIGNYAAIVSYGDEAIYEQVERLLQHISYFGYFNLDLKLDPRDGTFKFLDFNPRQGRSSYFTTLSGHNLARPCVEDLVQGLRNEAVHATDEVLWCGMPKPIVRHYTPEGPGRDRALALMREGRVGTTLWDRRDNDPRRLANLARIWAGYYRDFYRYFGHRELEG